MSNQKSFEWFIDNFKLNYEEQEDIMKQSIDFAYENTDITKFGYRIIDNCLFVIEKYQDFTDIHYNTLKKIAKIELKKDKNNNYHYIAIESETLLLVIV